MFGHLKAGNHGDPHLIGEIWGSCNLAAGLPNNGHDKQYWEKLPKRQRYLGVWPDAWDCGGDL